MISFEVCVRAGQILSGLAVCFSAITIITQDFKFYIPTVSFGVATLAINAYAWCVWL